MTIDPAGLPEDSTAPRGYAALQFDPAAYMHFVEDDDLTEEQAVELLRAIWSIVVSFVDLGYGLDPVHQVVGHFAKEVAALEGDSSGVLRLREEFANIANELAAASRDDAVARSDS